MAVAPSISTTQASGRSLHRSSGMAMTAASSTAGWPIRADSSSMVEIHSPPDFTRSLVRSTMCRNPCSSTTATSPVRSHPSSVKLSTRSSGW